MPTITADSQPDYDSFGIDSYWSCNEWIQWHIALKAKNAATANEIWQTAWDKQDSFEHDYNWCKYSGVFNKYVRENNLDATWWLPNILNSAADSAENLANSVTSSTQAAENVGKVLKYLLPTVVILASIGVLVYAAKQFNVIK